MLSEIWRTTVAIEELYDDKSKEFKETIPSASDNHKVESALRELMAIATRHKETYKANMLVQSDDMSALERRKIIAGLKNNN